MTETILKMQKKVKRYLDKSNLIIPLFLALGNEKDDLSPDRPFITLTVGELIVKMSHPKSSFLSLLDVIIIPQMLLTFTDIFPRKPKIYQCLPVKSIDLPF